MKNPLKYKNFVSVIREMNRTRLELRRARKVGADTAQLAKVRKKRYPYAGPSAPTEPGVSTEADRLPLVSVIVVGYNGAQHVQSWADSLKRQSYRNIEVIYVDNASADDSIAQVSRCLPEAKIINSGANSGFAEGNNIGMDHATGDFILLLNNDARLDDQAIEKMVAMLAADPELGAVSPKIRFWEPFVELRIQTPVLENGQLSVQVTDSTTGYKKSLEFRTGEDQSRAFWVPASARQIDVYCQTADDESAKKLTTWSGSIDGQPAKAGSAIPSLSTDGQWIINNAGSWVGASGDAGDWGLGEPDSGQFNDPCIIDAFCGCCVLIRPSSLGLRPLFPPSFFAYYEDTDASERIKANGFKIAYQPEALVYHKHASTSVEHSPFFKYFTRRNHSAFQAAHFEKVFYQQKQDRLYHWNLERILGWKSKDILGDNVYASEQTLLDDTLTITAQAINRAIYNRAYSRRRIGVFNEFWTSLGGGELRALHVALELREHGDVYVISRQPIDLDKICRHFGLSSQGLKQAVIPDFSEKDTSSLDIFINTAFCSKIQSRAKKSAYLVSFPHMGGDVSEMSSYDILLANSVFTQRWCHNYWPSAKTDLLYPAVDVDTGVQALPKKEKIIVSVGRFFSSGHNKKQAEMITAFRALMARKGHEGWRLVLIGGCNRANSYDHDYLEHVKAMAQGAPIDIFVDAPSEQVESYLDRAAIYWHSTGVGLPDFYPDQFEHFGMAIVEAMSHAAVPVIHGRGGAPEIVEHGKCGYCFDTIESLVEQTSQLIALREKSPQDFSRLSEAARNRSMDFSIQVHNQQLSRIVQQYLS